MALERVNAVLGPPSSVRGDTLKVLLYEARGLALVASPTRGVILIRLVTREAGAVDGIRVGDPLSAARARWGAPTEMHDEFQLFDRGVWTVALSCTGTAVSTLSIFAPE